MRALPISRTARRRFQLDVDAGIAPTAQPAVPSTRLAANLPAARRVAAAVNAARRPGEPSAQAGEIAALELLHEVFHLLVRRAAELDPATAMTAATEAVGAGVGERRREELLDAVGDEFPDVEGAPEPVRLEELLLVRVANENP